MPVGSGSGFFKFWFAGSGWKWTGSATLVTAVPSVSFSVNFFLTEWCDLYTSGKEVKHNMHRYWGVHRIHVATFPTLSCRVADPVHFQPDPDPVYQNFKIRFRILLALTKNQFKHLIYFISIRFLQVFKCWFFYLKKFSCKCVHKSCFDIFPCLYNFT